MNSRGQVGQILTSFPSLIYVFIIMLLFVIVSGFISINSEYEENLARDFAYSSINLDGKIITVKEAIEEGCGTGKGYVLGDSLKNALVESFIEKHGADSSFALATYAPGIPIIGKGWFLHAAHGVFEKEMEEKIWKVPATEFEKVFDPNSKNYDSYAFCEPVLFIKKGVNL